jgi:hypothetical protein
MDKKTTLQQRINYSRILLQLLAEKERLKEYLEVLTANKKDTTGVNKQLESITKLIDNIEEILVRYEKIYVLQKTHEELLKTEDKEETKVLKSVIEFLQRDLPI